MDLAPGVVVRPGTPDDLQQLHHLWSVTFPLLPPPDLRPALEQGRTAVLADGAGLAAAALAGPVGDLPRERRLTVLARDPASWLAVERAATGATRGAGLGTDVDRWHVTVREDAEPSLDCLRRAGYALASRSWGAHLDAAAVDLDAARRRLADAEQAGLVLRRLRPADAPAVHRLLQECRPDFPASPATPAPDLGPQEVLAALTGPGRTAFGAFTRARAVEADGAGGRLVGVTLLELDDETGSADTDLTAVAADHRGRGVATALKTHAVVVLLPRGVRTSSTGGAEVNEASLRANRTLGYRVEPLWLTWTRSAG